MRLLIVAKLYAIRAASETLAKIASLEGSGEGVRLEGG
jgi:hypothetical protein